VTTLNQLCQSTWRLVAGHRRMKILLIVHCLTASLDPMSCPHGGKCLHHPTPIRKSYILISTMNGELGESVYRYRMIESSLTTTKHMAAPMGCHNALTIFCLIFCRSDDPTPTHLEMIVNI